MASLLAAILLAALITLPFPNASDHARAQVFGYSFVIIFAIICGVAVYKTDQALNRRFNQNP